MLSAHKACATIPAADFERARAWYHDKLGLDPRGNTPMGAMYDCGGGSSFLLYPAAAAGKAPNTLMVFVSKDVPSDVEAMRRRGVVFEDYDFPGLKTVNGIAEMSGGKSAWFQDSEGNILAIGEEPA